MRLVLGRDVTLVDHDNFRELAVLVVGIPDGEAAGLLRAASAGVLDGDHAWLDIAELRELGSETDGWRTAFDAMIHGAESAGWVLADRVRAHVIPR